MLFKKQKKNQENQPRRVVRSSGSDRAAYQTYYNSQRREPERPNSPAASGRQVRQRPDDTSRGQAQEERGDILRRAVVRRRLALVVLTLTIVGIFASLTYVGDKPNVKVLQLGNTAPVLLHDKDEYAAYASQLLSSSLANRNKITVDTNAIEQKLQEQFPELSSAQLGLPLIGSTPTLTVVPSKPVAIMQTNTGDSVVVDSNGFVVSSVDAIKDVDLPLLVDQSGMQADLGKRVLPSGVLKLVDMLSYQVQKSGGTIESFILPAGAAQELDMRVGGLPYYTKFSTVDPTTFEQQVGSFLSLKTYLAGKGISPKEYADVRLPGRAYYK